MNPEQHLHPARRLLAVVVTLGVTVLPLSSALAAPTVASRDTGMRQVAATATRVPNGWYHWEGKYFTAWMPSRRWAVAEGINGIDVGSPTGIAQVGFGYATNSPAPLTLAFVRRLFLSRDAGLRSVRLIRTFRVRQIPGGQSQQTRFKAVRIRDGAKVFGKLNAQVFNNYALGAFGLAGYVQLAPRASWRRWARTLQIIQDHIVFYGHTPY